jgi:hypothetical protein
MIGRVLVFILILITNISQAQKVNFTKADTYQRHTELVWDVKDVNGAEYFRIMRSTDNLAFTAVKTLTTKQYMDFSSSNKLDTSYYFIQALNGLNQVIAVSDTIKAAEYVMSDDQLMDMVQKYTFRYFWDEGHPTSGMARERNKSGDIVTTGGTGFGIMGILVGIENGYISRSEGVSRIIRIISFLQFADRFHGVYPHWMNGKTGK